LLGILPYGMFHMQNHNTVLNVWQISYLTEWFVERRGFANGVSGLSEMKA